MPPKYLSYLSLQELISIDCHWKEWITEKYICVEHSIVIMMINIENVNFSYLKQFGILIKHKLFPINSTFTVLDAVAGSMPQYKIVNSLEIK